MNKKEKESFIKNVNMKEAMNLLLQAEARLNETKRLIASLKGTNQLEWIISK